ncbi:MAG: glycosyltransferase family 39 protein, partial [Candidatus Sumerlaeia bacterium]|nr:glycosyltransferase family 39 protein [Candidatus Sumerlaeia bacterium]
MKISDVTKLVLGKKSPYSNCMIIGIPVSFCIIFFVLASLSYQHVSPVGDTMLHYRVGEMILGREWVSGDPFGWDGTMPITSLNVLSDRAYLLIDSTPDYPEVFPLATLNRPYAASVPTILMGSLIIFLIWLLTYRYMGLIPSVFSTLFAVFEPSLLGNSRWITTDIPAALGFLSGLVVIVFYVDSKCHQMRWFLLLLVVISLVQLTKVTNLLLLPFAALAIIHKEITISNCQYAALLFFSSAKILTLILSIILSLQIGYSGVDSKMYEALESEAVFLNEYAPLLWGLRPVIPQMYTYSVATAIAHNDQGHATYFMGAHSSHGSFFYFPALLLYKTPIPILVLCFIAFYNIREMPKSILLVFIASIIYFLYFSLFVAVQIGHRHLLPVVPVMCVLVGFASAKLFKNTYTIRLLMGLVLWQIMIGLFSYPHYSSYFNPLIGGPYNAWKYFSDSNIDYDQDRNQVKEWIAKQNEHVHLNPDRPVKGLIVIRALLLTGLT